MKTTLAIATLVLSASMAPAFAASTPPPDGTVDRSQPDDLR